MLIISGIVFFICIITFFLLVIKKSKSNEYIAKKTKDILPYRYYDTTNNFFCMEDDTYMDMVQVKTEDLEALSENESNYNIAKWTRYNRRYADDYKIIAMNFPSNTQEQRRYFEKKMSSTINGKKKEWLKKQIFQLEWIEKNQTTREFYLMFFGKTLNDITKNRRLILSDLGTGKDGFVKEMSQNKKELILYKLNNKNAMVLRREYEN